MTNNTNKFNKNIAITIICFLLIVATLLLIVSKAADAAITSEKTNHFVEINDETTNNTTTTDAVIVPDVDDTTVEEDVIIEEDVVTGETDISIDEIDGPDNVEELPELDNEIQKEVSDVPVKEEVLFEIDVDTSYVVTFTIENMGKFIVRFDNYYVDAVSYFVYNIITCEGEMMFINTDQGLILDIMGEQIIFGNQTVECNGEIFGYIRLGFYVVHEMINGENAQYAVVSAVLETY